MMRPVSSLPAGLIAILLAAAITSPACADERDELNACKERLGAHAVAQSRPAQSASADADDAELQRCRQIIREWILRDARMSVDEDGVPLR